jgi:hypothetical protein
LPDERKLDLLKALAEISPFTLPQDSRQILPSVVQLLKVTFSFFMITLVVCPRQITKEKGNYYIKCTSNDTVMLVCLFSQIFSFMSMRRIFYRISSRKPF